MHDAEFLAAFRAQAIPHTDWNHRAHVRCAYLHLCESPYADSLAALRSGIKKLNASHGVVETPDRGYHETLTRAWLSVIDSAMRRGGPSESFEHFASENPYILCRTLLRLFYSPEGMPPESRYRFIPPDLTDLPR